MRSFLNRRVSMTILILSIFTLQPLMNFFAPRGIVNAQSSTGTGLKGEYFNNTSLSASPALTRTDARVDFSWRNSPGAGVNANQFSVRWTGQVEAPVSGSFTFYTRSDDGVRLWVNNALMIDNWTTHSSTLNKSAPITLSAGQRYPIRMEFFDSTSRAEARLYWSYPNQSRQIIPTSRLYPSVAAPPAPTNLGAVAGDRQVSLSWTPSPGAASYNVKRSTATGGPYTALAGGVASTGYVDSGVSNGTAYFYVVSAVGSGGESGNSNEASATPVSVQAVIPFTSSVPAIDGNVDALWNSVASLAINNVIGSISSASDLSAMWKAMWDSENIYLLIDVTDDVKVNDSPDPWQDDSVEVFIDGDNSRGASYDRLNDLQFIFGYGDATLRETSLGRTAGVRFAKADVTATRYRIEISIPWATIGVSPNTGSVIGIDAHIDDDDTGGDREGKRMWKDTSDQAWTNPSVFGRGTLTGGPTVAPPTNLAATASDARVSLNWNASAGASSYNVKRAGVSGGPYSNVATQIAATSYVDSSVSNGITYYYVVTAVNSSGESRNSNEASATPEAPPDPSSDANLIGMNAGPSLDWTTNRPFTDVMKTSRDWRTTSNQPASLDSNGWPTQDAQIVIWHGISNMHGTYRLSFGGQANVATAFAAASIQNKTYNSATNTTTADLVYQNTDGSGLQLTFTSTRRAASSATNTGVTNVKLMRPRTPGGATQYSTEIFTDQFKSILSRVSVLRTMDFTGTNANPQARWSDRTRPGHASQQVGNPFIAEGGWLGRGAAWEYAIAMANESGKDIWISVPAMADDEYISKLALLFRYGSDGNEPYTSPQSNTVWPPLDLRLKLYVEYSNEMWNTAGPFPQSRYNHDAAVAEVGTGSSPLNFDGETADWYWAWRRVAQQTVKISLAFRQAFGNAEMMTRVRPVLMTQLGYADGPLLQPMHLLQNYYNNPDRVAGPRPPNYYIYGVGGSAYYGPSDRSSVDAIFNTMPNSYFVNGLRADANWSLAFGLRRIAYEGGPSFDRTGNSSQDANLAAAWRDSRMRQEIIDHHNVWSRHTGDLLVYYTITHDFQWGFTDDVLNTSHPKLQAIDALNQSVREKSTYGTPIPSTIAASSYAVPPSWYGGGTSMNNRKWLGFPVYVQSPRSFTIVINASSASGNGQLEIIVDGQSLGAVSIPAAGGDTGAVSTPFLPEGSHGILIRHVSGSFVVNQIRVQ